MMRKQIFKEDIDKLYNKSLTFFFNSFAQQLLQLIRFLFLKPLNFIFVFRESSFLLLFYSLLLLPFNEYKWIEDPLLCGPKPIFKKFGFAVFAVEKVTFCVKFLYRPK